MEPWKCADMTAVHLERPQPALMASLILEAAGRDDHGALSRVLASAQPVTHDSLLAEKLDLVEALGDTLRAGRGGAHQVLAVRGLLSHLAGELFRSSYAAL